LSWSGLLFVVCFGLAVGLYGSGAGTARAEIVAYYASEADRMRQIAGFAALLAGCVFLLVHVGVLVRAVVVHEQLATIALLSGGAATLMLAITNALWAASAFTAEIERNYQVSVAIHLLIEDTGFVVLVTGMAMAIPFVAAVSLAATRAAGLPRWFGLLGGLSVVGLAAGYWYWPLAVFLVWIGCSSVLLARAARAAAAAPDEAALVQTR
jgi:hypothetical protein